MDGVDSGYTEESYADSPLEDSASSEPRLSGYAKSFLETIPEDHRSVVSQYLPVWDGNFTKYAQKVQSELKNYRSLGDYDTINTGVRVYQTLIDNPEVIYNYLVSQGYGKQQAQAMTEDIMDSEGSQNTDPVNQKLKEYEQALEAMASWINSQDQASREAYEREALLSTLDQLEQQYGSYDRTWVLRAIASGSDPEEAVVDFHNLVQSVVNERARPAAPRVLSGAGLPPVNKPDLSNASSKDTKDYISKMLSEMSRE